MIEPHIKPSAAPSVTSSCEIAAPIPPARDPTPAETAAVVNVPKAIVKADANTCFG
ncbi:hypothetical protein RJI07_08645 [Mycoplasmatota bacterium WC30]